MSDVFEKSSYWLDYVPECNVSSRLASMLLEFLFFDQFTWTHKQKNWLQMQFWELPQTSNLSIMQSEVQVR